ncbi:MAG: lactonase family protein [Firmicutes bacterium]|nr:lactonase family protein [Candidatus Colimorpha enterica]
MTQHIYIASCAEDGGILHCVLEKGKLNVIDRTAVPFPMYMIIDGNRMHVLLRCPFEDNKDSGVVTYTIREDGSLDPGSAAVPESTQGVVGCHLSVLDGVIYAANYTSGSVIRMPDRLVKHEGHSVNPARQSAPHCHYINSSPDGKYLLVCDLGTDEIVTYGKEMNRVSSVSLPAGDGPRHLAFSPDGKFVYCACELSSTCAVFGYDDGVLTFLDDVTTLPADYSGETYPAAIRCRDGRVYVSNRGHDSVTVFGTKEGGAKLTALGTVSCGGSYPRDFDLFGEYLICTNERTNNVTVSRLTGDCETVLTDEIKDVTDALCVVGLTI